MGQSWDKALPDPAIWGDCLRVLKPGGFAFIMALPRMYHRLAVAVEDAGFIVHSPIAWAFASGFPKANDVGKQIDKMAGAEREVLGINANVPVGETKLGQAVYGMGKGTWADDPMSVTAPASPLARFWDGWKVGNSCLKPAYECILWAQKPTQQSYTPDETGKAIFGEAFGGWCECEEE